MIFYFFVSCHRRVVGRLGWMKRDAMLVLGICCTESWIIHMFVYLAVFVLSPSPCTVVIWCATFIWCSLRSLWMFFPSKQSKCLVGTQSMVVEYHRALGSVCVLRFWIFFLGIFEFFWVCIGSWVWYPLGHGGTCCFWWGRRVRLPFWMWRRCWAWKRSSLTSLEWSWGSVAECIPY